MAETKQNARFLFSLWLALLLPCLLPCLTRATEPQSFYVNYSARVPTPPLLAHPLSIVHPSAELDLAAAQKAGNAVLAYISVGELASDAPYRADVLQRKLPLVGRNETWKSDLLDLADPRWAAYLVDELAAAAARRGFDGFFLDTLDSIELIAPGNNARTAALRRGLVEVVKRLRTAFPTKRIVINRGFMVFDELRDTVDGVLAESLFETHDFATKTSRTVSVSDTTALTAELRRVRAAGRAVYVLDYAPPADAARARTASDKIRSLGFHAFISTPELDGEMLAPLRPVARRICTLFGNLTTVQEDQVKWPADSFAGQRLQAPLEWLGYRMDYFRIGSAADLPKLDSEYRAILLSRGWQVPVELEAAVLDWLIAQRAAGRKIVLFGELPFRDFEQRTRFMKSFGLAGSGAIVAPPLKMETLAKEAVLFDYEVKAPALSVNHLDLRAPADAKKFLTVRGTPLQGAAVVSDPVFTCAWGGVAFDPYLTFRRADYRDFWNIDPIAFFRHALGELGAPIPDATTRDGLRAFLSHIDGDGFANFSRVEAGKRSAEIVRDRILKKYPLPVTVSIIEAELRGLVRTQRAEDAAPLQAIAKEIFALPHVELASHSFSHPFFWIEGDRTESFYEAQALDLKVPYPHVDVTREIEGSVKFINEQLAPPGKRVQVFLWSGNCRVPPSALALTRRLGIENVNGGDTIITERNKTLTAIAPSVMPWGDELQVYAPNQNENVYTNNWRGPLFGTFTHVLETYQLTETPRRFKPVNLYYHFYSGDFESSLLALERICDWAMTQPLHALTVSHYARIARDAYEAEVLSAAPDRWTIVTRGDSRTLRISADLAARIDLARSTGVTGWKVERDQAYVHTDGRTNVTLAFAAQPLAQPQPRLESSSAEIAFSDRAPQRLAFKVSDLRPSEVVFAGLAPRSTLKHSVNGEARTVAVADDGRARLALPREAEVVMEVASP